MDGIVLIGLAMAAVVVLAVAKQRAGHNKPTLPPAVMDSLASILDHDDIRELTKELDTRRLPVLSDVVLGLTSGDRLRAAKATRKLLAMVRSGELKIATEPTATVPAGESQPDLPTAAK